MKIGLNHMKIRNNKNLHMKNQTKLNFSPVAQEWNAFLTVLQENKISKKPLLKKVETPFRLVNHLEKQFGNKAA